MTHPCYICGEKIINPFNEFCYDHEIILQSLTKSGKQSLAGFILSLIRKMKPCN